MKYAKYWGAIADHSGDAYFDFVYWHDWPNTLNELARHRVPKRKAGAYDARRESSRRGLAEGLDDGRIRRFLAHVWKKEKLSTAEGHCIMNLCMAATYDPDPKAPLGFRVPFNLESGEVIAKRWSKWREHDPINLVARYRDNLKSLRGIYIDCGWRDQYHIHYGARILSKRLAAAGIRHTYEEFDDNHSDVDYRMDTSLKPDLVRRFLQATAEGWKSYLKNPAAGNALIKQANPQMEDELMAYGLRKMQEFGLVTGGDARTQGILTMTDARWKQTFDFMASAGLVKPDVDYRKAYTRDFVKQVKVLP